MDLSDRLDEDIARVRAEIQSLTQRKKLLTASLLSSTKVQSQLGLSSPLSDQETNPLILSQIHHNESNVHRLAYGVTAFPFHDPNPEVIYNPLLGIRFDVPSSNGKFERAPYYIFCKRVTPQSANDEHLIRNTMKSSSTALEIHHHTIPALVPLEDYVARYLPPPSPSSLASLNSTQSDRDEGYHGSGQSSSPSPSSPQTSTTDKPEDNDDQPKQDLHALVAAVRNDLVSWTLRQDSLSHLCSVLDLPEPFSATGTLDNDKHDNSRSLAQTLPQHQIDGQSGGKHAVSSIVPLGVDARLVRVRWSDGRIGRIKILDDGSIKRVIVFGEEGRLRHVERVMNTDTNGGKLTIVDLAGRLEEVERRDRSPVTPESDEIESATNMREANADVEMTI